MNIVCTRLFNVPFCQRQLFVIVKVQKLNHLHFLAGVCRHENLLTKTIFIHHLKCMMQVLSHLLLVLKHLPDDFDGVNFKVGAQVNGDSSGAFENIKIEDLMKDLNLKKFCQIQFQIHLFCNCIRLLLSKLRWGFSHQIFDVLAECNFRLILHFKNILAD